MSKRVTCVAAVLLFNLLTPAPAAAQFWDIIRWFNDMSGPQMWGVTGDIPIVCDYEGPKAEKAVGFRCSQFAPIGEDRLGDRRSWSTSARLGVFANTKAFGNDENLDGAVTAFVLGAGHSHPLLREGSAIQIDGLAAVDFVRFTGPQVDAFWVPTVNVGAAFRYGGTDKQSAWKNGLRVSIRYQQFFDTFGGERFGAPGAFESSKEGIWQFALGWIIF
jgi:hypothetical protein